MIYIKFLVLIIAICVLYELFIVPILKKKNLSGIEKKIYEWAKLVSGCGVVSDELEKKEVSDLLKEYEQTKFDDNQINLKIEIAKLIFNYILAVHGILIQNGKQLTSFGDDDSSDTIPKLIRLEKEKRQLESAIKNLLSYIR